MDLPEGATNREDQELRVMEVEMDAIHAENNGSELDEGNNREDADPNLEMMQTNEQEWQMFLAEDDDNSTEERRIAAGQPLNLQRPIGSESSPRDPVPIANPLEGQTIAPCEPRLSWTSVDDWLQRSPPFSQAEADDRTSQEEELLWPRCIRPPTRSLATQTDLQ